MSRNQTIGANYNKITINQFEKFWNDNYFKLRIKNPTRIKEKIKSIITEAGCESHVLDEYVISTGSETLRRVVVEFFKYIEAKYDREGLSDTLAAKKYYKYAFERQLEMAKFLSEERTVDKITEKFNIDERTARSDLQELAEGITVMGAEIIIDVTKEGHKKKYKSTLHPVFLPLNLIQLYTLTVHLEQMLDPEDPYSPVFQEIVDRIKGQMSPTAFKKFYVDQEQPENINNYINYRNYRQDDRFRPAWIDKTERQ